MTKEVDMPIACTLKSEEFHRRECEVQEGLMSRVIERVETDEGYAYWFAADVMPDIAEFIDLERQCCPFLDFRLSVPRGGGEVLLELFGPAGAKEFIGKTFRPAAV